MVKTRQQRIEIKERFLRKYPLTAFDAFAKHDDYAKKCLIHDARKELGYSDGTHDKDIWRALDRVWRTLKT